MVDESRAPSGAQTVVLIEDDEAVRAALAFSLALEGFKVEPFATADELLARNPLPACAALVIDYWLPDLNGIALLARLRASGLGAPALLITSNPSALLRARASAAGAHIVEKPLIDDAIVRAVRAATSRP